MSGFGTDIRIKEVRTECQTFLYRYPMKFGNAIVKDVVMLSVTVVVETRDGATGEYTCSMPIGNIWAWQPSTGVCGDDSLRAMQALIEPVRKLYEDCTLVDHPVGLAFALEEDLHRLAADIHTQLGLASPMPHLAAEVIASPFNNAVFGAYGVALGRNSFDCLSSEFMAHPVGHYVQGVELPGIDLSTTYLSAFVNRRPPDRLPIYHLCGQLDPISEADIGVGDVPKRPDDGLPFTFPEWITAGGLRRVKIKLCGFDVEADLARTLAVHDTVMEVCPDREVWYSGDFNEKAESPEAVLEYLAKLHERRPEARTRLRYIEQPTHRDLWGDGQFNMQAVAKLVPVAIDESLLGVKTLMRARELGYSGAAYKACKSIVKQLVVASVVISYEMFQAVQDLTCPGESFASSAALAARIRGIDGIEGNGDQYVPVASDAWRSRDTGLYSRTDGHIWTGNLTYPGLGLKPAA